MVIYLDVIFINHYIVNRILVLWMQAFFSCPQSRLKREAILVVAALWQIPEEVLFLQGTGVVLPLLIESGIVVIFAYFLFRIHSLFPFLRFLFVYFAGNVMLGGLFGLYGSCVRHSDAAGVLGKNSAAFYPLLLVFMLAGEILCSILSGQRSLAVYEAWVDIRLGKQHIKLKGYMDSGNFLRDDLTGQPVVIGDYSSFRKYLSGEQQYILDRYYKEGCLDYEGMCRLYALGLRTMACGSVGAEKRSLPVLTADEISYVINRKNIRRKKQSILLSGIPLFQAEGYDLLLHKNL
ncbi:MAG: sigma-E processing peptidase SpoIIGA [Lachnospiraceae bacterium]|nr:sigma-E processing peptidase SpoIIGA [Lachnospiraceae bacterium]